jgi:signal transduction histidine kinase
LESINHYRIVQKSIVTLFVSAVLMFVFEYIKQSFIPHITIWYSHSITIIFVSILSSFLSYYIFIAIAYKRMYAHELSIRKKSENDLLQITINQDEIILNKTAVLIALNEELKIANDKIQEVSDLKSFFLQNISHEIRTPLNAIMGFSQLIELEYNDSEKVLNYSTIIINRSIDLLTLIDELLIASRLEVGKMPMSIENFALQPFLDGLIVVFENLQVKYNKQDLEFIIHCSVSDNTTITTDKSKLYYIFSNLIHNAFKFTYSGKIEIGFNMLFDDEYVFYVSDTGIGIDENKQQFIFEKFTQIEDNAFKEFGGFGLGLSIVKGFVTLLHGNIFVTSSKGLGSVFTFIIPYAYSELNYQN